MKARALAAVMLAGLLGAAPAEAQPIRFERFGVYLLLDDPERAERFYTRLLGAEPQVRTPALIGFDIAGGLFTLVSRRDYGADAPPGGAVRPYIRVADLAVTFAHVRLVAPESLETQEVVEEGRFRMFRLRDPEGNVLEFFELRP